MNFESGSSCYKKDAKNGYAFQVKLDGQNWTIFWVKLDGPSNRIRQSSQSKTLDLEVHHKYVHLEKSISKIKFFVYFENRKIIAPKYTIYQHMVN